MGALIWESKDLPMWSHVSKDFHSIQIFQFYHFLDEIHAFNFSVTVWRVETTSINHISNANFNLLWNAWMIFGRSMSGSDSSTKSFNFSNASRILWGKEYFFFYKNVSWNYNTFLFVKWTKEREVTNILYSRTPQHLSSLFFGYFSFSKSLDFRKLPENQY